METVLTGEGYTVACDAAAGVVALKGVLRLNGIGEYAPVVAVLNDMGVGRPLLTINVVELEFLNSSGIAMLSRFVIEARNAGLALKVVAAENVPWQGKSLRNLQRLMPALDLVFG
jgi:hypothetical protein